MNLSSSSVYLPPYLALFELSDHAYICPVVFAVAFGKIGGSEEKIWLALAVGAGQREVRRSIERAASSAETSALESPELVEESVL